MTGFIRTMSTMIAYCLALAFSGVAISQTKNVEVDRDYFGENLRRSILVISHERILDVTELGRALRKRMQESEEILRLEALEVENYFIAEEQRITKDRENLSAEDFLRLSNEFDDKVETERQNQRQKEQLIKEKFNRWKNLFYNIYMIPVIEEFMEGYGASLVINIDRQPYRAIIFDSRINITDQVISKMNATYVNIDELVIQITS